MSKTKNDEELIQDLKGLRDGSVSAGHLLDKMDYLNYKFDCSDGFEDVVDAIRPFIRELTKSQIDEAASNKILKLIDHLEKGASPSEYEHLRFHRLSFRNIKLPIFVILCIYVGISLFTLKYPSPKAGYEENYQNMFMLLHIWFISFPLSEGVHVLIRLTGVKADLFFNYEYRMPFFFVSVICGYIQYFHLFPYVFKKLKVRMTR